MLATAFCHTIILRWPWTPNASFMSRYLMGNKFSAPNRHPSDARDFECRAARSEGNEGTDDGWVTMNPRHPHLRAISANRLARSPKLNDSMKRMAGRHSCMRQKGDAAALSGTTERPPRNQRQEVVHSSLVPLAITPPDCPLFLMCLMSGPRNASRRRWCR